MGEASAALVSACWPLLLLAGIVWAAWKVHRKKANPKWNALLALLDAARDQEADSLQPPDSERNTRHVS